MTDLRKSAPLVLILLLAGCVGFSLAKGGQRLNLGQGMSVQPAEDWNRWAVGKYEYWTLDGLNLQHILIVNGAEDGDRLTPSSLIGHRDDPKEAFPRFRKGMSLLEVRELYEATLAREKAQKVVVTEFAPAKFAGREGFRFSFTFQNEAGLDLLGTATGAIIKDRLYMLVYRGTKLYFYDRHKRAFEQILSSVKIS